MVNKINIILCIHFINIIINLYLIIYDFVVEVKHGHVLFFLEYNLAQSELR